MEAEQGVTSTQPILDEDVIKYRRLVQTLVENLMEHVVSKDESFSEYKIFLSGSTAEGVRVGNPYEMDFLIQYDIDVKSVEEVPQCKGFVYITPDSTKFQDFVQSDFGLLSSDQILFEFFMNLFHYANDVTKIKKGDPCLQLDVRYQFYSRDQDQLHRKNRLDSKNFRRVTSLGAALPFLVRNDAREMSSNSEETIDVVLSFHLKGYWPESAAEWKEKYKTKLEKEAYDFILQCGVSTVCKTPVQEADTIENVPLMFRLSFSRAETKLMELVTPEQKEAYRCLKILRETELTNFIFYGLDMSDLLKKRFTSYHLKSLFFSLTTGIHDRQSSSEWFVALLSEVIKSLANREIKHHFISGINLLENVSVERELWHSFMHKWAQLDIPFYHPSEKIPDLRKLTHSRTVSMEWHIKFKSQLVPSEYLIQVDNNVELDTCTILRKIFEKALHSHQSSGLPKLQQKCLYKNTFEIIAS